MTGKPVWLSVSVDDEDGTKLRSGEPVTDILPLLQEHGPAAVLVNCSAPEAVATALPLLGAAGIPTGGYANGFVSIAEEFNIPVRFIGVGEQPEDLQVFNAMEFVDSLLPASFGDDTPAT